MGFLFFPVMPMGLRWAALRAAGAPLLVHFDTNRIYNKILDRDWFSARLFVTQSARDHVGVQLQVSDLNFL